MPPFEAEHERDRGADADAAIIEKEKEQTRTMDMEISGWLSSLPVSMKPSTEIGARSFGVAGIRPQFT